MAATIKTNNQPRELKSLFDFSLVRQQEIRSDFDWMEDIETTQAFFEYRGSVHHLANFMRVNPGTDDATKDWDGYEADSYCTATLVRVCSDSDFVIVGRYLA